MSGIVPTYPPDILDISGSASGLRAAAPIKGTDDWQAYGSLANYLIGHGSTLIASGPVEGVEDGNSLTARFYIWPHEQNYARLWTISLVKYGDQLPMSGSIEIPDSTEAFRWRIPESWPAFVPQTFYYVQIVDPSNDTPGEIAITMNVDDASGPDSGNFVYIQSVGCTEIPRYLLEDFGSVVVPDLNSLRSPAGIYDSGALSIAAVCRASVAAKSQARRACLYSSYFPTGSTQTDTTFDGVSDFFHVDRLPTVVPRRMHQFENSRTIAFAALVSSTGGSGTNRGEFRITNVEVGTPTTVAFPTGTVWVTGTVECSNNDPDELDEEGGDGGMIPELRRTGTTTNVTLYGLCLAETD